MACHTPFTAITTPNPTVQPHIKQHLAIYEGDSTCDFIIPEFRAIFTFALANNVTPG